MQKFLIASLAAAATLGTVPLAAAGECPEASVIAASMTSGGHTSNIGVVDTVLAVNHLGDYHPELSGRDQRVRHLTIAPGGEVAWHSHADRPALIYVIEGEIVEYRSTCAAPIVHRTGEVAMEFGPLEHWWKNETDQTVTLLSADLPRAE